MGRYIFKLPDLGEGVVEAEIVDLHVNEGDEVGEDQPIADMMTDKATVELPSPVSGKILSISGTAGDVIAVGKPLFIFEVEGEGNDTGAEEPAEEASSPEPQEETKPAVVEVVAQIPAPKAETPVVVAISSGNDRPLASPAVRKRALDADVDLSRVPGSGPAGRISHQDLDDFIASGGRLAVQGKQKQTAITEQPVIGLRRKIAERMAHSKRSIPHYSYIEEIDVTDLEKLRQHMNANREEHQPKLTFLPFLMQAMVKAMAKFPQCNAHFDQDANLVRQYAAVHIGIAAQTPNGLMVPVVSHSEARDVWDCADEVRRVSEAAKTGKATRDELSGSTITITSLGRLGGLATTPVINSPEVSIIGVNNIVERPVVRDGQIVVRKMMNLSSSFDHRIVDGYDAAEMIQYIKGLLENPASIFV